MDDTKQHTRACADFKKEERAMMAYIVSQISATAMVALNSDPLFEGLLHRAESVPFMKLITKLLSGSTNAKMILHRMTKAFGIKMDTGTHEEYIEKYRAACIDISTDLGVVCRQVHHADPTQATSTTVNGEVYIKLSDVGSLIYLSGLDQAMFRPKLDQLLLLHPTGRIPDTAAVIQKFQLFYQQCRVLNSTIHPGASALAATTLNNGNTEPGTVTVCDKCNKQFESKCNWQGQPFRSCVSCWTTHLKTKKGDKPDKKAKHAKKALLAEAKTETVNKPADPPPPAAAPPLCCHRYGHRQRVRTPPS